MTLPAGITTATVTYGKRMGVLGTEATFEATVQADRPLVWAATGDTIDEFPDPTVSTAGGFLSFQFPHTDQPGFVDEAGNEVVGWAGIVKVRVRYGGMLAETITKPFQVPVGQTVVDLDLVPSGSIRPAVTAPVQVVTSVNGQTGAVMVAAGSARATYDVRDYGAELNGSTDDSPAVQAAIDACAAAGGGQVVIPAQSFTAAKACKLNTTIRLKSGVWLKGPGAAASITGAASPMIALPTSGPVVDRVQITDLFLQSPVGVGISLDSAGTTGGYQLGWPRITVENVTVADAGSHAFEVALSGVIETRFINCVTLRAGGHGFSLVSTDLFLYGCTAAAGTNPSYNGFDIRGANNKLSICKAYGNQGNGFKVVGAGRHVLSGCESQDNARAGYSTDGAYNTITGCLSDSDGRAGFELDGSFQTVVGVTAMAGGGGSGQVAPVGILLAGSNCRVAGLTSNLPTKIGGSVFEAGNTITVGSSATRRIAYAPLITPDPYQGDAIEVVLTGNLAIATPTASHRGQRLTFLLKQDLSGGRTVTFSNGYLTSWTPNTAPSKMNVISFVSDGISWIQESTTIGLDLPPLIADDFSRADSATSIGATSVGGVPWVNRMGTSGIAGNQLAPVSSGRSIATVDTGRASGRIKFTFSNVVAVGGFVFRYVDNNNYLYTYGNTVGGRVDGADRTYVSGLGVPLTSGDVYELVMAGTSVSYLRNGSVVWNGVINDLASATSHGVLNEAPSNRMDDFSFR